jgi:hypothetical protein
MVHSNLSSRSGMSLPSVLLGLAMVTAAAAILYSSIAYFRAGEKRAEGRVYIQNALLESAAMLRSISFDDLLTVCLSKGTLNTEVLNASFCLDSTNPSILNSNSNPATGVGQYASLSQAKAFDVRLDLRTGRPSLEGQACIALFKCNEKVINQFMEIQLLGYWTDPDPSRGTQLNKTTLSVLRTRD